MCAAVLLRCVVVGALRVSLLVLEQRALVCELAGSGVCGERDLCG